jgi:hypothetical protein
LHSQKYRRIIEDLYIISGLYPDLTISSLTMVITLAANKKFKKKDTDHNALNWRGLANGKKKGY